MFYYYTRVFIKLFLGFLLISLCACGDQKGGWKSKGGDKIPPPSFAPSMIRPMTTDTFSTGNRTSALLKKDVLVCSKKASINKSSLELSYDIFGSLMGFKLNQYVQEDTQLLVSLNKDAKKLKYQKISKFSFPQIGSNPYSKLKTIIDKINKVDHQLASKLEDIIFNSEPELKLKDPGLEFYKTATDGRKCFTLNLITEDLNNTTYTINNTDILSTLSTQDQSLLLLQSAFAIYSHSFDKIFFDPLNSVVYYMHTQDFLDKLESPNSNIKNQFQELIQTFMPNYESEQN